MATKHARKSMANLRVIVADDKVSQQLSGRCGRNMGLHIYPGGDANTAHEGAERVVGDLRGRVRLQGCDKT